MSIDRNIQSTVFNNPYSNRVEIRMCAGRGENVAAAQSVIFSPATEGSEWAPALSLTRTEAQALFDEFIRAGFRPSHQVDAAGALQATRDHLADMREIAFSSLKSVGIEAKGGAA